MPEQTWPPELQERIKPFVLLAGEAEELHEPLRAAFPIPEDPDASRGRLVNDLAWTLAADLSVSGITRHLLQTGSSDLTLCYLALPDVAGHRFWRYHAPEDVRYEVSEADLEAFGDYINLAYVEADRLLGELLAEVSPDATVVVLSDHGMHVDPVNVYDPAALASGAHEDAPDGIVGVLGGHAARLGNRLDQPAFGDVYQVAPMLMHLLDLPVPGHWRGVQARSLSLERLLDEGWRLEHPLELGPNPDPDFRPATPSRVPFEGSNAAFIDDFQSLGYLDGYEPPPESDPPASSGPVGSKPLGEQPGND